MQNSPENENNALWTKPREFNENHFHEILSKDHILDSKQGPPHLPKKKKKIPHGFIGIFSCK